MGFFGGGGVTFNSAKDIPSLRDKVILVTGGSSGLGKQSILDLARHGPARIFLAARDLDKAAAAIDDIKKAAPDAAPIEPLELDLASLASVKKAAAAFTSRSQRLDILMLNAGIMSPPHGQTQDGYEIQFGTNHMGHALLAKLLLPILLRTAEQHNPDVRVVVLSSEGIGMAPPDGICFADLKTPSKDIGVFALYGQSKLANALFVCEFARQYPALTAVCIHPGAIMTNLGHSWAGSYPMLWVLVRVLAPFVLSSIENGVRNQLWGAVGEGVVSGEYYCPVGKITNAAGMDKVKDEALAKRLWDWTEEELKGYEL
ncbi:NAD(P)-binding protein [Thozetella sp. PMI_491]|nr:NAD(P)-binding protein [Thozetella sp. PMI_491]